MFAKLYQENATIAIDFLCTNLVTMSGIEKTSKMHTIELQISSRAL